MVLIIKCYMLVPLASWLHKVAVSKQWEGYKHTGSKRSSMLNHVTLRQAELWLVRRPLVCDPTEWASTRLTSVGDWPRQTSPSWAMLCLQTPQCLAFLKVFARNVWEWRTSTSSGCRQEKKWNVVINQYGMKLTSGHIHTSKLAASSSKTPEVVSAEAKHEA